MSRSHELLGEEGSVALRFDDPRLQDRWTDLIKQGAVWRWPSYKPHVTLFVDPNYDISKLKPYPGPLKFGPEEFKELDDKHRVPKDERVTKDVADEPRDEHGRWTSGGTDALQQLKEKYKFVEEESKDEDIFETMARMRGEPTGPVIGGAVMDSSGRRVGTLMYRMKDPSHAYIELVSIHDPKASLPQIMRQWLKIHPAVKLVSGFRITGRHQGEVTVQVRKLHILVGLVVEIMKSNPHHDEKGKFAFAADSMRDEPGSEWIDHFKAFAGQIDTPWNLDAAMKAPFGMAQIDPKDLYATQDYTSADKGLKIALGGTVGDVDVARTNDGKFAVLDGHHSAVAAAIRGDKITARVHDVKPIKVTKSNPNHDERGRFASGEGAKDMFAPGYVPPKQTWASDTAEVGDRYRTPSGTLEVSVSRVGSDANDAEKNAYDDLGSDYMGDTLTQDEVDAVDRYTGTHYEKINDALRAEERGGVGTATLSDADSETIEHLANAIDKSVLPRDTVVMRGIYEPFKVFGNSTQFLVGQQFHDAGFVSTTMLTQTAVSFAVAGTHTSAVMRIELPKGSNALHVGNAEGGNSEGEIILPPGSTFEITGVQERAVKYSNAVGSLVGHADLIHARLVPQERYVGKMMDIGVEKRRLKNRFVWQQGDIQLVTAKMNPYHDERGRFAPSNVEHELRGRSTERGVAFNAKGEKVLDREGSTSHLHFSAKERRTLAGTILTHNHPSGMPVSENDIAGAREAKLAEIRTVTNDAVYSVKPQDGKTWPSEGKLVETLGNVRSGMPSNLSPKDYAERMWERAAPKMGLVYTKTAHVKKSSPIVDPTFRDDEKKIIDRVIAKIPPFLLANVERIAPEQMGEKHGLYDPDTKTVELSTYAFTDPERFGPAGIIPHGDLTVAHEIGHSVYDHILDDDERKEWRRLSGWRTQSKPTPGQASNYVERRRGWESYRSPETHAINAKFVSSYAEKNSGEDFADTFSYIINGQNATVPKGKREFMEQVVSGGNERIGRLLKRALYLIKGSASSGNYGHEGRPGIRGGSGKGEGEKRTARGKNRTHSQTPSTFVHPESGRKLTRTETGDTYEALLASKAEGNVLKYFGVGCCMERMSGPGNRTAPFDFIARKWAVEVKTLSSGAKNLKTAIKSDEIERKTNYASDNSKKAGLIVQVVNQKEGRVDLYGYKAIVSRNVSGMDKVGSYRYQPKDLARAGLKKKDDKIEEGDLVIEMIDGKPYVWTAGKNGRKPK